MDDRYITLAIHTYDYAIGMVKALKDNGIAARLEDVDLQSHAVAAGVRVRIPISDLALALRIVENSALLASDVSAMKTEGIGDKVLIPVDFSDYSRVACRTGFAFANMLGTDAVLLHVYASPYFDGNLGGESDGFPIEISDSQMRKDLADAAHLKMRRVNHMLRSGIIAGKLPAVKFATEVMEGVPEDVILDYTRRNTPMLIVMATRGADKKASDMIGSVTAEVVDSCRIPILTIPENFSFTSLEDLSDVAFFCNVDQQDFLAMDVLIRIMDSCRLRVHLVPVSDNAGSKLASRMETLENYFREHYPTHRFMRKIMSKDSFRSEFEDYISTAGIKMLVVPNKKKNVFSRLFSPGIAHRIVFERDIPMLALPV